MQNYYYIGHDKALHGISLREDKIHETQRPDSLRNIGCDPSIAASRNPSDLSLRHIHICNALFAYRYTHIGRCIPERGKGPRKDDGDIRVPSGSDFGVRWHITPRDRFHGHGLLQGRGGPCNRQYLRLGTCPDHVHHGHRGAVLPGKDRKDSHTERRSMHVGSGSHTHTVHVLGQGTHLVGIHNPDRTVCCLYRWSYCLLWPEEKERS